MSGSETVGWLRCGNIISHSDRAATGELNDSLPVIILWQHLDVEVCMSLALFGLYLLTCVL